MQGWIKLYREVLETDLWYDVTTFRLFTYLLLNATHQDGIKKGGVELKRGQWIRSYRKLAQDLAYKEGRGVKEYSIKTISKCVKKLVDAGTITVEETKQGTLFTIVNYAKYQDKQELKKETGNASGNEVETNGERSGNNNKNGNKGKNDKNVKKNTQRKYAEDSIYIKLAKYFVEQIRNNNPDFKDPNYQRWANDIRLMMEIDKRTEEQIRYLMRWVQQDNFEMANVLSPAKLRKRFDQLVMKVKSERERMKNVIPYRPKQEQPQGRYIPKDAVVDINAGEDPNWTWKKPF
jgi:hypothetical protein